MTTNEAYNIPPKQTLYHGIKFRSRLEARWAVVWDGIGLEWQYEPERFVDSFGEEYTPDFYFPDYKLYAEVKATDEQLFASADKIAGAIDYGATDISYSNGLLLLGQVPFNETDSWGYGIHGKFLYWEEGINLGDFYILQDIAFENGARMQPATIWINYSSLDGSSAPDLPPSSSVRTEIVDFMHNSAFDFALRFARRARFDFDDNFEKMFKENRNIIGGTDNEQNNSSANDDEFPF